ncbi:MAG TPA: c-type cytochrome [Nitrospirota bacterium]|nr:c-type cytochrome [Nitrospirota bacterium]
MSEYDGIEEREEGKSKMPLGMTVLFAGLIIFGICYMYFFSPQTTGWSQLTQYQRHIEVLRQNVTIPETKETARPGEAEKGGAADLALGRALYRGNCAMCHGENFEGGIGPALGGPKFIYGNRLVDYIRVISAGTPKGMPSFSSQLSPEKIRAVATYAFSRHMK